MYRPSFEELVDFQSREGVEVDHEKTMEGVVYMVSINHKPTFCYFVTTHKTCMEAHVMVTKEITKYPITFQKTTKEMIKNAFEIFDGFDTMVMDVIPGDKKWAETLGFKKGPNCDNLESIEGYSNYTLNREDI